MEDSNELKGNINGLTISDLYTENWEHIRHVENERMGFTSVYFVILAAAIGFISKTSLEFPFAITIFGFLLVLSVIGALISFRLKADLEAHGNCLRAIVCESQYQQYFTFGAERGWTTKIKLRLLFPIMYVLLSSVFLIWIIIIIIHPALLVFVS
jgi:hypothetical protein